MAFTRQELIERKALQDQGADSATIEAKVPDTTIQPKPSASPKTMGQIDQATAVKNKPVTVTPPAPAPVVAAPSTPKAEAKTSPVVDMAPQTADEMFASKLAGEKVDFTGAVGQAAKKRYLTAKANSFSTGTAINDAYKQGMLTDQNIKDIEALNPDAVTKFKELKQDQDILGTINTGATAENITPEDTIKSFSQKFADLAKGQEDLISQRKALLDTPEIKDKTNIVNEVNNQLNDNRLKQQRLEENIRDQFSGKATEGFIQAKLRKESRLLRQEEQELMNESTFAQNNLNVLLESADSEFDDLVAMQELKTDRLNQELKLEEFAIGLKQDKREEYQDLLLAGAFNDMSKEQLEDNDLRLGYPVGTSAKLIQIQTAPAVLTEEQQLKNDKLRAEINKIQGAVEQTNFRREVATPTGNIISRQLNGRNVALDETAFGTINDLNADLLSRGLEPLQINDSYRSSEEQAGIIMRKAGEFGIKTEGLTIEQVADKVRDKGFPVANPGQSLHQSGMSIDIPGDQVDQPGFIDIMKKYGWHQIDDAAIRANDRGHFNFKGVGTEPKPIFKTIEAGKNYGFATRMLDANILFESLEGVNFENDTDEYLIEAFGFGGKIPNQFKTEKEQTYDQAKRNFINAVLRKESGAVISDSEFENAEIQYFPQPGDTQGTLKQKRENRERTMDTFFIESGNYEMKDIEEQKRLSDRFYDLSLEVGDIYNQAGTGAGITLQ